MNVNKRDSVLLGDRLSRKGRRRVHIRRLLVRSGGRYFVVEQERGAGREQQREVSRGEAQAMLRGRPDLWGRLHRMEREAPPVQERVLRTRARKLDPLAQLAVLEAEVARRAS